MGKTARRVTLGIAGVAVGCVAGAIYYVKTGIEPLPEGKPFFIRFEERIPTPQVATRMKAKGIIRNATAFRYYALYRRYDHEILPGTYQVKPGMTADELMRSLRRPIRQMVRIPETNPSYRTARLLEAKEVTTAADYEAALRSPQEFAKVVTFPLPKDSLEGYLYPDTYDLPPLLGARGVIERQLQTFEKKALPAIKDPKQIQRTLIIASMIELEAGRDDERAKISGVIHNRLAKKMKLQIDATVLYGMRDWRRLYNRDYRHVSPYNTYLIDGLPPGPICSPSLASIVAAQNPEQHEFLYYVAKPDRYHLFAKTYEEHLKNVALARKLRDETPGP